MVSTKAAFPQTVDQKVVCAKSIIQAVVAAHDAEALDGVRVIQHRQPCRTLLERLAHYVLPGLGALMLAVAWYWWRKSPCQAAQA
jgi:hypothetical protein